jgi:hypothetical protein
LFLEEGRNQNPALAYVSRDSTSSLPGVCRFTPNTERLPIERQNDAKILWRDVRIFDASKIRILPHITAKSPTSNPGQLRLRRNEALVVLIVLLKAKVMEGC